MDAPRDPDDDITDEMFDVARRIAFKFDLDEVQQTCLTIEIGRSLLAEREAQKDLDASIADMHDHRGDIGAAIRAQ